MINKKFDLYKEPYLRKADYKYYGTSNIMIDYIISLLPIILIGWYQNGIVVFMDNKKFLTLIYPLLFVILGALFCFIIETICFVFSKKKEETLLDCLLKSINSYSIIPGLLLSLILPLKTPIWILFIACLFSSIIGKYVFGGIGKNIFNPALLGYIFVFTSFYSEIYSGSYDIVTSVTPLDEMNKILNSSILIEDIINAKGLMNIILGLKSGTMAETSIIACVISFAYLVFRKVIDYEMPIICILSFFLMSMVIGYCTNINGLLFSIYNLCSGGIIFGSIFMLTDPVTSPRSIYGRIIFSFFVGVISLFLRLLSDLKDGTSTAILFMNMISLVIDNFGAKLRVETVLFRKLKFISIIVIITIFVNCYSILKINSMKIVKEEDNILFEIIEIKQDYSKLNDGKIEFIYTVRNNNNTILINCDIDGNVLNDISDLSEEAINDIKELIIKNKINKRSTSVDKHKGYIISVEETSDGEFIIVGCSRGYVDNAIITVTYKDMRIINVDVNLSLEKELNEGLKYSSGSLQDIIDLGEGNKSDIVSNVTYTSVSVISCRQAILTYINNQLGGSNE